MRRLDKTAERDRWSEAKAGGSVLTTLLYSGVSLGQMDEVIRIVRYGTRSHSKQGLDKPKKGGKVDKAT